MISKQKEEEKKKDEVLQQINDLLEQLNWGCGCDRLIVKLTFEGKYKLNPSFHIQKKERLIN